MLTQYVSYDDKMLQYIEHALSRLEKTKIAFENYWSIDPKLNQPVFYYSKIYIISHVIHYIWNYGSVANYNITYSKAANKYLLKAFYNKTNKKEYHLQIQPRNVCHTNIIAMKDMILVAERGEELLAMENVDKIAIAEVTKVLSTINRKSKYSWVISNTDMDTIEDLGWMSIKKYKKYAGQIQDEVYLLNKDWIPIFGAFVKHSRKTQDNEEIIENLII